MDVQSKIHSTIQKHYPIELIDIFPDIIKYHCEHVVDMRSMIYDSNIVHEGIFYDKLQNITTKQHYFLRIRLCEKYEAEYLGNKYMYNFLKQYPHKNALIPVYYEEHKDYEITLFDFYENDLCNYVIKKKNIFEKDALHIFVQITSFVKHLHDHNIIHCDLKPDNILITNIDNFDVKITDFETCVKIPHQSSILKIYNHRGTRDYYPPETLICKMFSTKTDIWSLGTILYTMITGYLPIDRDIIMEKHKKYKEKLYSQLFFSKNTITSPVYELIKKLLCSAEKRMYIGELYEIVSKMI